MTVVKMNADSSAYDDDDARDNDGGCRHYCQGGDAQQQRGRCRKAMKK